MACTSGRFKTSRNSRDSATERPKSTSQQNEHQDAKKELTCKASSLDKAGDEARTRDSLLGRQVVTLSPLASYKVTSHAALALQYSM